MHESKQFVIEWITLVIALVYDIDYNKTEEYSVSIGYEGDKNRTGQQQTYLDFSMIVWTSLDFSRLVYTCLGN